MNNIRKRVPQLTPGASSRLAAGACSLPFLLALPSHVDPALASWNLTLAAVLAAVFLLAQLAARRAILSGAGSSAAGFAALYAVFGLLGYTATLQYRFSDAITDLALLYLVFFVAAAASRISAPVGRAVFALLVGTLGAAALVQSVHVQTFGFAIGAEGYRAILQSSSAEALEFVSHFVGAGSIGAAAAVLAVVVVATLSLPARRASWQALLAGGAGAAAAIAMLAMNGEVVAARLQGFEEASSYAEELIEYRALLKARRSRPTNVAVTQDGPLAGKPQTYVFIVGESLTRNHMSLYGYWRDTTPALSRLADEMAVFTDVVSPHSHTEPSLEQALTLANQANGLRFTDAENYSLIEILRAAGFDTWWISNQNTFGPWDNKTAVLASGAKHVHFTGTRSGSFVTGPYDEALLEPLAAALQDPAPRKAIFLHFLGNHWEYAKRFPQHASVFSGLPSAGEMGAWRRRTSHMRNIDAYDNAVRYHDGLAARTIEMVRAAGAAAAVVLFSDHGENVYEFKAHHANQFTRDHVEVPLLLWFSPEYLRVAGEVRERSRAAAHLPFALEDLPHLVADVAGLRGAVLQPERSPLSERYRAPASRTLFGGSLVYEDADEPILNVRRALQRIEKARPELQGAIWAHRVNTLGKMMEAARLFPGAEMDVFYDALTGALTVNHPPDPPSGLRLDDLLAYANRLNPELALWLDLKNLDEANAARVLEELNRLDARHAIRRRALVETVNTGPASAALRKAGYLSSYYLPTDVVTQRPGPGTPGEASCRGAAEIQRVVEARSFAAVSYDWRGRHWVERCLGRFVRERRLRSYTWDLALVLSDERAHEGLHDERLRGYSAMTAVLLPFRSVFDDRR